jgi:hypothetical protein
MDDEPRDQRAQAAPGSADPAMAARPRPPLGEAAKRALAEAEARRAAIDAEAARIRAVKEKDGRDGPEPVRYGDWEVKGIASDF